MACQVHKYHSPKPLRTVIHHIQPQAMGGADTPENKIEVCDTGHYNIHRLMANLLKHEMFEGGTRTERGYAKQGYDWWVAANKPGRPVYELPHWHA